MAHRGRLPISLRSWVPNTWLLAAAQNELVPATEEDYARLAAALDQVADLAEERGLLAHYHPHLTTMAETPEQVRKVFSSSKICFCPDTAHLFAGGGDPGQTDPRAC